MQTQRPILTAVALLALLFLTGCATPANRIRHNQALFDSFPPEAQEKIRQGQADIGFSPEMATMALGRPSHIYHRQTEAGSTEVWSYVDVQSSSDMQMISEPYRYRDSRGRLRWGSGGAWIDVPGSHEYETLRLEFQDKKVKAIETLKK